MLAELEKAARGEHASNLGAPLARAVADAHGARAFVVDPVAVDELEPVARITGLPGVERRSFTHALNIRAVARRHAASQGRPLGALRLVVAHLGTGISLAALRDGRMVDVVNPQDEGPMSGDRAGAVPATALLELCFAPGATRAALRRRLFGDGGLFAHLGTRDVRQALRAAEAGDARAALLVEAVAYQVAKSVGALAAALEGRVDAVLLTGGLAHLSAGGRADPQADRLRGAGGGPPRRGRAAGAGRGGAAGAHRRGDRLALPRAAGRRHGDLKR